MKKSTLESGFETYAKIGGLTIAAREFKFLDDRKFRFDFAWPDELVAVEIEGGIWTGGGHTRGKGYASNCEKYNLAAVNGWSLLRYTTNDLKSRPMQVVDEVKALIVAKQGFRERWSA